MDRLWTFYATLGIEQSKEKRGKEEVGFAFLEFASNVYLPFQLQRTAMAGGMGASRT